MLWAQGKLKRTSNFHLHLGFIFPNKHLHNVSALFYISVTELSLLTPPSLPCNSRKYCPQGRGKIMFHSHFYLVLVSYPAQWCLSSLCCVNSEILAHTQPGNASFSLSILQHSMTKCRGNRWDNAFFPFSHYFQQFLVNIFQIKKLTPPSCTSWNNHWN